MLPRDGYSAPTSKWTATGDVSPPSVSLSTQGACSSASTSTLVDSAAVSLAAFAAPREEQPAALFHRDWRAHVNRLIDDWCLEHGVSRSGINRSQRLALIADLDGRGVFDTRNAAAHVASALDVSRATVYALRKEHSGSRTTGQQT